MRALRHIISAMVVAIAVSMTTMVAYGQQQMVCSSQPQPIPCARITSQISGGILPTPGAFTLTTQGPSTFNLVGGSLCCNSSMEPFSWTGTGQDEEGILGPVTWGFPSQAYMQANPCPQSTIVPLIPGQSECLPAVADLYFHVEGTVTALPGMVFRSMVCIHIQNSNMISCNPLNCETFVLVNGPVPFQDQNGAFAFNLDNLTVVLDN